MPYQVNNNDGGLLSLLGLAQGVASFVANQKQHKNDMAQQAIENSQRAQQLALDKARTTAELAQGGFDANGQHIAFTPDKSLTQVLPHNKGKGAPTSDDYVSHYLGLSAAAMQAGRPDLAATYKGLADSYGLDTQRTANADYTSGAKTNYENALTDNARNLFAQQRALLDEKGRQMMDRALAAARSRVGRGAPAGTAEMNALNAMSRTIYGAQIRSALDQYNQQQQDYRASLDSNGQPPQGAQAPTFNMNIPPPTIYVMGPNGQPMAVQAPQAAPQQQSAPKQKAQPKAAAKAPQQSGGGFNPIGAVESWFSSHFGGGGSPAPTGAHRLRATSHGQPIHSVDGGKTWQPGP